MSAEAKGIFARIVAGEIPCHRIFENAHVLAFLDINPLVDGHTLVIPKREVDRLEKLTPDEAAELGRALPVVAAKVIKAVDSPGYNVLQNNGAVSGQEVAHVHFHIIPRRADDGLGYRWLPRKRTAEELAAIASKINGV